MGRSHCWDSCQLWVQAWLPRSKQSFIVWGTSTSSRVMLPSCFFSLTTPGDTQRSPIATVSAGPDAREISNGWLEGVLGRIFEEGAERKQDAMPTCSAKGFGPFFGGLNVRKMFLSLGHWIDLIRHMMPFFTCPFLVCSRSSKQSALFLDPGSPTAPRVFLRFDVL